jgi:hypothetical protein
MRVKQKLLLMAAVFFCASYSFTLAQSGVSEIKYLSESADLILTGKVTQQASSWNDDKTRIYTKATIQVDEYLKGTNQGNTVTINYPGGEVGEIGEVYSHMPRFQNDEEVLVFLKKDEKNSDYKIFNGENGKIRVISDPQTGEKVTTSNVQINSLKTQIKNYIND